MEGNMRDKGHIYPKTAHQRGQNINNDNFLDFHPFVEPLILDTVSLAGYDVNQFNLDDL